jgi:putative Mg2+ transporter-C (MgtC) family protein
MDISLIHALRLIAAVACGGFIGWERASEGKPTGVRTQMLVCLGSCLFMVAGEQMRPPGQPGIVVDPSRLAAGVVTGIGFLGAGAILRTGASVIGLTSAASIWVTSAIGVAIGAGAYLVAIVTTLISFVVLRSMIPGMRRAPGHNGRRGGEAERHAESPGS